MAADEPQAGRRVFVIGASGGVGTRLLRRLGERGHRVSAMHRSDDGAGPIADAGAEPVRGDLAEASAEHLADLMRGHDAVVFTAGAGGAGGDAVERVDRDGAKKAVDAASAAGVRRFALVSVFMDAWRGEASPGAGFERYMAAKRAADVHLAASDLDFLAIRPGALVDDGGTGLVNAGIAVGYGDVPRDDVAAFIAAALFSPGLNRVAIEVTAGEQPIEDAIAGLQARTYARSSRPHRRRAALKPAL